MPRLATFDETSLAAAGLEVVARDGWDAVSMRSVALELGVSPMALYRLAPDADTLRRRIADAAAEPIEPDTRGLPVEALERWAETAYRHLTAYPGLAAYVIHEWTELPGWLDIVEAFLRHAAMHGLTGRRAVATVNAVFAYVLVRAQLHDSASRHGPRDLVPTRRQRARYSMIRENIAEFTTAKTDTHFLFGLTALTTGLQAST